MKERHARSPCFNDKCLFRTSMDAFPEPKAVVFNGNLQTIEEQNQKFIALPDYPTNEFFNKYAYNHAVDNDPQTCWNSFKGETRRTTSIYIEINNGDLPTLTTSTLPSEISTSTR